MSATRAGARIASAEPRVRTFAQDAANQVANASAAIDMSGLQAMWVYQADSNGNPVGGSSSFTNCSTCVKFTWDNTNRKFVQGPTGWTYLQRN